jgi:hypothetical protein
MLKVLTHNLMLIVAWLIEVFYRATADPFEFTPDPFEFTRPL